MRSGNRHTGVKWGSEDLLSAPWAPSEHPGALQLSQGSKSNLPFSPAAALALTRTLGVTATVKAVQGWGEEMRPLPPSSIRHSLGAFLVIRTKKWLEARDLARCPTVSRSLTGDNQSLKTNTHMKQSKQNTRQSRGRCPRSFSDSLTKASQLRRGDFIEKVPPLDWPEASLGDFFLISD